MVGETSAYRPRSKFFRRAAGLAIGLLVVGILLVVSFVATSGSSNGGLPVLFATAVLVVAAVPICLASAVFAGLSLRSGEDHRKAAVLLLVVMGAITWTFKFAPFLFVKALIEGYFTAALALTMWLTTEDLGEIADVRADQLAGVLDADSFGSFVVLSESENGFMQAASNWSSDDECEAFIQRHGSDPWILEYRDASSGKHFQVTRNVTLVEVKDTFLQYLRGAPEWRARFQWIEIDV